MYPTTQSGNLVSSLLDPSPGNPTKALSLSDISNMVEMANRRAGNYNVNPGTLSEVEEQQLKRARDKYMFNFPGKELPLQLANVDAYRNFQMAQLPDQTGPDPYMGGHMNPRSPGDYALVPEGGIGGGSVAGGMPTSTSSYDPSIYGPTQSAMGDTRVADPYAFEPEYTGERLLPSAHEPGIASLLDVSPEQRRAMQEQIGGPGFHSPPTFAATNHAQMGPLSSVTLGQSDPNFHAPEFTRSDKPGGLLANQSGNTGGDAGWDRDERWRNASNRNNRWQELVGMGLFNMGNNMMRENTF